MQCSHTFALLLLCQRDVSYKFSDCSNQGVEIIAGAKFEFPTEELAGNLFRSAHILSREISKASDG